MAKHIDLMYPGMKCEQLFSLLDKRDSGYETKENFKRILQTIFKE
jgi:hypothetical protein